VNRNLICVSLASTQLTAHILFSSTELPGRIVILSTIGELFLIDTESLSTTRPNFPSSGLCRSHCGTFLPTLNSLTPIDRFSVSKLAFNRISGSSCWHIPKSSYCSGTSNFPCYLLHTLSPYRRPYRPPFTSNLF
jgi:hypothetical protein